MATMLAKPPKVLCVMDLSVVGRAGLSAVLPVLAACGVQGCGLPAALFSTHTGGFGAPARRDEAAFCREALAHYAKENVDFDAIYIGYLYSPQQFALADAALDQYPGALHVVDPALGDAGRAYSGLADGAVERMRALCQKARLITPNDTESAMLTGAQPTESPLPPDEMAARINALAGDARAVLVTSVPTPEGGFETLGRAVDGERFSIPNDHVPMRYPGTGDTLTAAVVGLMLGHGLPLKEAAQKATAFVQAAVHATFAAGAPARDGLWVEPFLPMLSGKNA